MFDLSRNHTRGQSALERAMPVPEEIGVYRFAPYTLIDFKKGDPPGPH
jgi:hypothetical protein